MMNHSASHPTPTSGGTTSITPSISNKKENGADIELGQKTPGSGDLACVLAIWPADERKQYRP